MKYRIVRRDTHFVKNGVETGMTSKYYIQRCNWFIWLVNCGRWEDYYFYGFDTFVEADEELNRIINAKKTYFHTEESVVKVCK